MVSYWFKYNNETVSGRFTDIDNLAREAASKSHIISEVHTDGGEKDIKKFFAVDLVRSFEFVIYDIKITNLHFSNNSSRRGYKNHFVFEKCEIDNLVISSLELEAIKFKNCTIKKLEIKDCLIKNGLQFKSNCSVKQIDLYRNKSIYAVEIESSKLHTILFRDNIITECSLKDSEFTQLIDFSGDKISSLDSQRCKFNRLILQNVTINEELELAECKDDSNIAFVLCKIEVAGLMLNGQKCKMLLDKIRSTKRLTFRLSNNDGSIISLNRNYYAEEVLFQGDLSEKKNQLSISETVFKELVLFDNDHAKCLKLRETLFQKGVLLPIGHELLSSSPWWKYKNRKQERSHRSVINSSVWCILKNQSLSRNDKIKALEYRKYEMSSYAEEIKKEKGRFEEKIVLLFNWLSNNHGHSWGRGFVFTFGVLLFFFIIFIMSADGFGGLSPSGSNFLLNDKDFWVSAVNFLWLPYGTDLLVKKMESSINGWFSIIMILSFVFGKIFIAYGVFQTISAFRKHGQL